MDPEASRQRAGQSDAQKDVQNEPLGARSTDRLFAALQYVLPKHALSRFIYRVTRSRSPQLKNRLIRGFLKMYSVDMSEAAQSDPLAYASFNEFFTRALQPQQRPIAHAADAIVSPVDGTVSQCGPLNADSLLQAKGQNYSLATLLAKAGMAQRYLGGEFICLYLAPHNYHRIHMPVTGTLREALYVPGELFSVNAATARAVPRLFARNERVVCDFDSSAGGLAVVLVGALFVGSIETVWAGEINPPPARRLGTRPIARSRGLALERGAELGRFNMGSTVIMIFEPGKIRWTPGLGTGTTVWMGEQIAQRI